MRAVGIERREELSQAVNKVLSPATDGFLPPHEAQAIDFKEEAGRRAQDGTIEPGEPINNEAATRLADEVACMANTPGGGALIVGVADDGEVIGTQLDIDWLRQRIDSAVHVAPDIVAQDVSGLRVLVIYVAEAMEPVPNTSNALRWRVGDSCQPVDRAEWWESMARRSQFDPMAQKSRMTPADVSPAALRLTRNWVGETDSSTAEEFLRRIGALRSDGHLTQAAKLAFTPGEEHYLKLAVFDVPGGHIINRVNAPSGMSLIEQLDFVEKALGAFNQLQTTRFGLAHRTVRQVPESAVREALLNGIIHRDWNRRQATQVRWYTLDSTLEIRSPGGFPEGISSANVLSNRAARYPALADLFRALGLVEKQGVGVDRMYQAMITLGHRPPEIIEVAGPYVECRLSGGEPVYPVLKLVDAITPRERRRDYRISVLLYYLFQHAFVTPATLAEPLQSTREAAIGALRAAEQTMVSGEPLVRRYKKVWVLSPAAKELVATGKTPQILCYASTDSEDVEVVVREWLNLFPAITTGDLGTLCGVSRGTARKMLDELSASGVVLQTGQGRATRFVPADVPK